MTRRRFNRSEHNALFLAADGRCVVCGNSLPESWHADHVIPHARGGATDVFNGQALCPRCNLQKGSAMQTQRGLVGLFELRDWQRDAWTAFQARKRPRDFLCVATPGAGKTTFALYVAAFLIESGSVRRIVVVVPTDHLRRQWMEAAARVGIQLDDAFANRLGREPRDFDGVVVTYHQVAREPLIHRASCDESTHVIFDELHHAGDMKSWGRGLKDAFEHAGLRLALTGTPFRSDNHAIPFVDYGSDGRCRWDWAYSYGDALRDRVCRPVFFPSYEGNMRWWTERHGEVSATFRDGLSDDESARRLRVALHPDGDWLRQVLRDADEQLREARKAHHEHAAGLVIAMDQDHARAIAEILEGQTGERPALAISDEPEASTVIDWFANGREDAAGDPYRGVPRWLVAVKMVSEGVDIPRLFVGVYATHVVTELYFRQAVGRFVRTMGLDDESGYLFIPREEHLIEFVQRIKEERDHEVDGAATEERARQERTQRESSSNPVTFLDSEARPDDVFFDQARIPQDMVKRARSFALAFGWEGMNDALLAKLMIDLASWEAFTERGEMPVVRPVFVPESPLATQKRVAKKDIKRFVSKLCVAASLKHERVYGALKRRQGIGQEEATLEQLDERKALLKGWIELAVAIERSMGEWEWDEVMIHDRQSIG